jgi:hypothetical protein|tara:strand:- start:1549 stop:1743 length:195 start_codon:yes stop_codon:yes gene_type:complete
MALRINGQDIVSDALVLSNLSDADVASETVINEAIKNQANVLRIYDSAGTEIRTLFCAATVAAV